MKTFSRQRLALFAGAFALLELTLILFADRTISAQMRLLALTQPAFVDYFRAITQLGKAQWYEWPSGLGVLLCLMLYYKPGRPFDEQTRTLFLRLGIALTFFFVSTACAGILTDVLKPLLGRARPKLLTQEAFFGFRPFSLKSDWNSMPSGHTATAFAVAMALMAFFPHLKVPLFAFAFLIGLSRIVVNAHYFSDVLFGAAIGITVPRQTWLWFTKKGLFSPKRVKDCP